MPERKKSATSEPTPRWVKIFGVVFAVLLLGVVLMHLTGHGMGGMHGH